MSEQPIPKRLISIVTPCYNEEDNVDDVYRAIKKIRDQYPRFNWEHIFIDNASIDNTLKYLKVIADHDHDVKIIVNQKNYGHIRSPAYGYLNSSGDATIAFFCDLLYGSNIQHLAGRW